MRTSSWDAIFIAAFAGFVGYQIGAIGSAGMRPSDPTQEEILYRFARGFSDYKAGCGAKFSDTDHKEIKRLVLKNVWRHPNAKNSDIGIGELGKNFDALVRSFDDIRSEREKHDGEEIECLIDEKDAELIARTVKLEAEIEAQKAKPTASAK